MDGLLQNRDDLEALFNELSAELERLGLTAEIVMVGGAWMLWHTQRVATRDVDSARKLPGQIDAAIKTIAERHDLEEHWLNDHSTAFWPATADYADCAIGYETATLKVLVPPPNVMFLMKLDRSYPQDIEDMRQLWPMCDFESVEAVAEAYAEAYPLSNDPYMASHIETIIGPVSG